MPLEIYHVINLDVEDIADHGNREDLIQFVKDLDAAMQDWGFTLALCEHFAALKLDYEKECAEDEAKAKLK